MNPAPPVTRKRTTDGWLIEQDWGPQGRYGNTAIATAAAPALSKLWQYCHNAP